MPPFQPDAPRIQPPPRQQLQQLQTKSEYPKPIPEEKLKKGVTLLAQYRFEKDLGQQSQEQFPNYLNIPSSSRQPPSIASDPRSPSAATISNYGGVHTESVVSFEGNESPSSATANTNSTFISYKGKVVKQRRRANLNPTAKAKAALIRYLGSCQSCRGRRVQCPLEHHDIAALERLLPSRPRSCTSPEPTRDHSDFAPAPDAPLRRHVSDAVPPARSLDPQSDALFGLGQNPTLNETPTQFAALGPQSLMASEGDILYGIHPNPIPEIGFDLDLDLENFDFNESPNTTVYGSSDSWGTYRQADMIELRGDMIELGVYVQGWGFRCRYIGPSGQCLQRCLDIESLQVHFETHTAFTRISPPDLYYCVSCHNTEVINYERCLSCADGGSIEYRVYGNRIRQQNFQRYSPDGNDHFERNSADPFYAFSVSNHFNGMGPSNGNNSSGGMGQGGYNPNSYTYQAYGPNSGSGSQGTSFETFPTPPSGNFQFHGSQFGEAGEQTRVCYCLDKALGACQRHKLILIATALLSTVTFVVETHDWFIAKARVAILEPNLPIIAGFIVLLASFTICYTFWSMKHSARERRSQWRSTKYPISELSSSASFLRCAPIAPPRRIRGGIYS